MATKKKLWIGSGLLLATVLAISTVLTAQDNAAPTPQGDNARGARQRTARGGFDRGNFQERLNAMLKQELGASDEEWTVIEPRLTKVMTLSREANTRQMTGMMRMGGAPAMNRRPGMDPGQAPERQRPAQDNAQQSDVQKATVALRTSLEKTPADASDIQTKLTALREAREKARQDMVKSQQELREVLTLDQEAKLVLAGLLD